MSSLPTLQWTETTRNVSDLKPFEANPRHATKEQFVRMVNSIREMGYHDRIKCQPNGLVIGGHLRIKALKKLGIKSVPVLIPNRELTDDEYRKLLVTDNLQIGGWDFDSLSSQYEIGELIDWGFPANELPKIVAELTDDAEKKQELKETTCPACGHIF